MQDDEKTKDQLIDELRELRSRVAEFESDKANYLGTEKALTESEEKFRFLTEAMVDIMWTMDLNLRTTYVSPSIERLLGLSQEERKRQTIEEQVTPESLLKIQEILSIEFQCEQEGTADPNRDITIETEDYRKDGSTAWLENKVRAIRDSKGTLIGLHGLSRDITERKRMEEKLRTSEDKFSKAFFTTPDAGFFRIT